MNCPDLYPTGDALSASERHDFQAELEFLRGQASRVDELVEQNADLQSKLEQVSQPPTFPAISNISLVNSEVQHLSSERANETLGKCGRENERLQEELKIKHREYGALVESHNMIIAKYKQKSELCKSWLAYYNEKKRREARTERLSSGTNATVADESHTPDMTACLTPINPGDVSEYRSTSGTPRAESRAVVESGTLSRPPFATPKAPFQHQALSDQVLQPKEGASLATPSEIHANSSEASGDSGQRSQTPELPVTFTEEIAPLPMKIPTDDESDVPVVVSERTLKRKRDLPARTQRITFHESVSSGLGSALQPVLVKSEQAWSSPIATGALQRSCETHDTLDLDEVGQRVFTPRKRRRLQEMANRTQGLRAVTTTHRAGVQPTETRSDEKHAWNVYLNDIQDDFDSKSNLRALHDKASYARIGQEYGIRLWEEDQRKATSRGEIQAKLDAQAPEALRGNHNSKLDWQWLHNRRVHQRQAKQMEEHLPSVDVDQHDPTATICQRPVNRALSEPNDIFSFQGQVNERKAMHRANPRALQPTDNNAQILPRTTYTTSSSKRFQPSSRRDRGAAGVPFLAEDGEGSDSVGAIISRQSCRQGSSDESDFKHRRMPKAAATHRRLGNLLAEPSPEKPVLSPGTTERTLAKPSNVFKTTPARRNGSYVTTRTIESTTRPEGSAITGNKSTNVRNGNRRKPSIRVDIDDVLPEDEPLRARSLRRLRLDDFKINPAHNQGLDFAFDEVTYGRAQRKCLPGCSKPGCCGDKFRRMVKIGGLTTPHKSGLWDSSPTDEADEERRLLEAFLGSDLVALRCMSDTEKQEVLMQAKTKQLADEHSKHRQMFERRSTPPGFWRTDMPTTQEAEQDKEAAREAERQKLEERYREAMRADGRWMFRDE